MSFSSLRMSIYVLLGSLILSLVGSQVWALTMTDTSYADFQANNCMIPAGKNMCPSTLYVTTYAGRAFNVTNLNRGLTTQNLLTPDNYITVPGSTNSTYTVGTHITGDAANYISYGDSNNLNLFEGTKLIARAITSAKCANGTIWNGKICSTPGIVSPIVCTMETRLCPTNVVMPRNINTCEWLPDQCRGLNPIDPLPPTIVSRITLKSGNGDTVFTDSLYSNISKNYYLPEQVTKNITIPTTTSILNVTLSSSKAQCLVSPNYKTDSGIAFSNNGKIVNKADLPSFNMSIPAHGVASQIGNTLYGKISTITISCETSTESAKDLIIYTINDSTTVTPPETVKEMVTCYFTGSISSQSCSTNIGDMDFSCSGQYSCSVPVYGPKGTALTWKSSLGGYQYTTLDNQDEKIVFASTTTTCGNPGTVPVCIDGTPMERDPLTCQWLSTTCISSPVLTQIIIGDRVIQYTGGEIIIEQGNSVTLKGTGKAGSMVYLSREGSPLTLSAGIPSTGGGWNLSFSDPASSTVVIPGTYTYILSSTPPSTGISPGGSPSGSRISITLRSPNTLPPVTAKPILELFRTPKYLTKGQTMNLTIKTNATNLSYYCVGNGPVANKRVPLSPSQSMYTSTWETLAKEGWSGTYACDFTAIGTGGQVSISDSFTIAPADIVTLPPTPTYTDFQANSCIIPANKSTCASSIFVRAAAGKYFDVTNTTRGLTTASLLSPYTYVSVIGSTTPMYTITTHSSGDAANYLKYGVNDLILKEGPTVIAKAVATATCAKDTVWSGKMCITGGGMACTDVIKLCEDGSVMPRDPNCGWLPGQCGGRVAEPLTISCSKSTYTVGESISCKINGGVGTKSCWQLGTRNTEPTACTNVGWNDNSGMLYYYSSVSTSMLGEYALYVKDSQGTITATKVSYINTPIPPVSSTINFEANNCYIPAGQNKCASTLYVRAPQGKTYSVGNLNRGITTSNLLTPDNYTIIPGSPTSMYTVGANARGDAANYITYGESNTLTLIEGTTIVARAIASAKCVAGTTWNGKTCGRNNGTDPIYCTMEARMCEDGSTMPRDTKSCAWLPDQCPTELNPTDPISPIRPYGTPTIRILSIAGISLNGDDSIDISKSPTEPLRLTGEITSIRNGYTMKLTSNKSDYYMMMPVNANGIWTSDQSPTSAIYQSRMVVEGDNLLTFSLLDNSTKKPVAQSFIRVRVKFVRGGIIIDPPICVMAAGSTGSCTGPILPTYPNCPRTTPSSSTVSASSLIYCPPDDATEINPTNTINPKPPVTKPPTTSTGIRVPVEQPTTPPCSSVGGSSPTIGCTNNSVDVVIVEGLPTTPIEEALDAASRKRIDTIIARTRSRVADMSTSVALAFIDGSIRRIQALPNKTTKAKLIDAYTLSRLQSLRNTIKASSANNTTDDYIGLVDNVLSNSYQ